MKIYLFHPETGIYLGEDFTDDGAAGRTVVMPPNATTVAPPAVGPGSAPIFCGSSACWIVRNVAEIRERGAGVIKKE